ncbi:ribonuclease P protein subunit [Candidatus Woesearchaeota archaeon]|jgi:ribonuclease P protein subunit POP4|nr:ribonuclease P protein subunit [Candidatus Woesearchaeota archaeon]MBT6402548.1 ribonuclease P protein subunit [Candidatus Woesearchaeota archaeon]
MQKARDIPRIEFIGKELEVIEADNPSLVGIKGKVIDETKNMLIIEQNNETKKLVKKQVTIKVKIEDKEIIIKGEILQGRPEERLKKKIRI